MKRRLLVKGYDVLGWILVILLCVSCVGTNKKAEDDSLAITEPVEQEVVEKPAPPPPPPPPKDYIHTVRHPGECLWIISSWRTGKAGNWREIIKANTGLNPATINIGDKIIIPHELMRKYQAMPRSFVEKSLESGARKAKAKKNVESVVPVQKQPVLTEPALSHEQAAPEKVQEDVPLLFGPK